MEQSADSFWIAKRTSTAVTVGSIGCPKAMLTGNSASVSVDTGTIAIRLRCAYPSSQGWAVFRVVINLKDGQAVEGAAIALARAAIDFFKNTRSRLDSIWFSPPPILDVAPSPTDSLTLDGDARDQLDVSPSPRDGILIISIATGPLSDSIGPIMPTYDSHYRHSGITYGANEPILADSALVLNGAAILHGG